MKTPKSEGWFLGSLSLNSNEVGRKLAAGDPSCHHQILVTKWFVDLSIPELDKAKFHIACMEIREPGGVRFE